MAVGRRLPPTACVLAIWLFAIPLSLSVYVRYQPSLRQINVLAWARQYADLMVRSADRGRGVADEDSTTGRSPPSVAAAAVVPPLRGRTIVVTGATSGIGAALTRQLVNLGATVIALGRSPERLQRLVVVEEDKDEEGDPSLERNRRGNVVPIQADFADLKQVSDAVDRIRDNFRAVDMIVANAGMYLAPAATSPGSDSLSARTVQGYDLIFGVNYLSHVLLVEKLMPLLLMSERPVVVQVSSLMHFLADQHGVSEQFHQTGRDPDRLGRGPLASLSRLWDGHRAYGQSKLAQILYNRAAQRRYPSVRFAASCPGWVATNISRGHPTHPILHALAFDPRQWGISSILHALFDEASRSTDDDYYINSAVTHLFQKQLYGRSFRTSTLSRIASEVIGTATACLSLLFQKLGAWQPRIAPSSTLSYNITLQDEVYAQSLAAVAEWL